jgi:diadenosine tetraphosphate (Ap4A) HIT family hydrolase
MPQARIVAENELAFAVSDLYPVTEGHTLVIPKRHIGSYFALYQPELNAVNQLLQGHQEAIRQADTSVVAFNIGVNDGIEAGQTIGHCHVHLIPRRRGDMTDPRGGVRGVIPEKRIY